MVDLEPMVIDNVKIRFILRSFEKFQCQYIAEMNDAVLKFIILVKSIMIFVKTNEPK